MPDAERIATTLAGRANGLDRYLTRVEQLHGSGDLSLHDVERAYSGGFLEFHAFLERSIEKLFVGLLRQRLNHPSARVRPLIVVNSDAVAHKIILGERSYADWLPFKRLTIRRAEAFFSSGLPFSDLDNAKCASLDTLSTVRNALAHQSAASLRAFHERFIAGKFVPPAEHRPAAYLRGMHSIDQSRMNFLLSGAVVTITELCT